MELDYIKVFKAVRKSHSVQQSIPDSRLGLTNILFLTLKKVALKLVLSIYDEIADSYHKELKVEEFHD